MKTLSSTALCLLASVSFASAEVRSGKATADWLVATETYEPGKPVQTGLRLVLDDGFHTYWSNPGESGMKISVSWELPVGWAAGEVEHPVPVRFETGGLANFGYKGTVIFPVKLTPPANAEGPVKLTAKVSWLSCDDSSCIPGEAALDLPLKPGLPVATAAAREIDAALARVPRPRGFPLTLVEKPETLLLSIQATDPQLDFGAHEFFPATPELLDPAAKVRFTREGAVWTAEVAKNDYFKKPLRKLVLVFAKKGGAEPFSLSWRAE